MNFKRIAIAGVTGAVGREILSVLEQKKIPFQSLKLLASANSVGKKIIFRNKEYVVEELTEETLKDTDIVLFSCGSSVSKKFKDFCLKNNIVMIDNSSAFRMSPKVPLIIPEINAHDLTSHDFIIANPNCSTIILLMGIFPLHQKYPIKKVIVSTYQAASGAGMKAMQELEDATAAYLNHQNFQYSIFSQPYAFNIFSHNSKVDETGYNEEEIKMILETQKILSSNPVEVSPTCVRVPVMRAHSESIYMEFKEKAPTREEATALYHNFDGVEVLDNQVENLFPTPLQSSGKYSCFVGRIRSNYFTSNAMEIFITGDQLLKGAALNAVQIAELCLNF